MNEKQEKLFSRIEACATKAEIPAPTDEQRAMVIEAMSLWPDIAIDLLDKQITKAEEDKIAPVTIAWEIMERCQAFNSLIQIFPNGEELEAYLKEGMES